MLSYLIKDFGQGQQARMGDLQAQQGLGTYQAQLGQGQQGFEQAGLRCRYTSSKRS